MKTLNSPAVKNESSVYFTGLLSPVCLRCDTFNLWTTRSQLYALSDSNSKRSECPRFDLVCNHGIILLVNSKRG